MRFDGKVAMITGAAHGMGASFALGFAKEGADIVAIDIAENIPGTLGAKASSKDLAQIVKEIKATGRRAIGVIADISKPTQVKAAVDKAIAEFTKIDILVNNAGVFVFGPIINATEQQINNTIDVNLKGTIYCCKYVVPHMAKRRYGKIINILSGAALYAEPTQTVYGASKYGVRGLTEALAAEVAHYNINVNGVCPGTILTPMLKAGLPLIFPDASPETSYSDLCNTDFFRREVTAQDVTNAVLFLASEEARNITSHLLPVTAAIEKKTLMAEPYFSV
jgi:NAD(P)-dependent dehydrogenase (short-subunit alcohol dehydrogenase family)